MSYTFLFSIHYMLCLCISDLSMYFSAILLAAQLPDTSVINCDSNVGLDEQRNIESKLCIKLRAIQDLVVDYRT